MAGLSPRRPGYNPRPFHVDLCVEGRTVEYVVSTSSSVFDAVESQQLTALFNNALKNERFKLKCRLPSV